MWWYWEDSFRNAYAEHVPSGGAAGSGKNNRPSILTLKWTTSKKKYD